MTGKGCNHESVAETFARRRLKAAVTDVRLEVLRGQGSPDIGPQGVFWDIGT